MKPYAELLEFNQPNPIRKEGFTRIRDAFPGLADVNEYVIIPNVASYDVHNAERIMEFAGRWDYGPNNARKLGEMSMDDRTMVPIIRKYISMGHESMIEMGDATFFIECSRAVGNELVRHRIASFQQESQRFSKFEDDDDAFFVPELEKNPDVYDAHADDCYGGGETNAVEVMERHNATSVRQYNLLIEAGVPKQIARYVLPVSARTRIVMKANAREWRHIMKLRTDKSVQPEMRELALMIYDQLVDIFPNAMKGVIDGERGVR